MIAQTRTLRGTTKPWWLYRNGRARGRARWFHPICWQRTAR